MDANRNRGKRRAAFQNILIDNVRPVWNQAAADNNLGSHQFIICCAQFGRDSLFYMILGTEGWAADLRWPKADVEGESV